ncbi:MAG: radical SAM protein [Bacteroidales bacterium]|nr:radical SAM protein [Bacteroidales bacterium]
MPRYIDAKTILSTVKAKPDTYFGLSYNMNLYRGCQHGCIYCDSRSECYKLGDLSDIRIKKDAIQILERELRSKRIKGTVGFGSMNDCYMPVEREHQLTRKALQLMVRYKFPVHIITKSDLVTRDADLLKEISKVYAAVSVTITTTDDELSKIIEPNAPVSSKRFEALKQLSAKGIYCGITFMPVLPHITDTKANITEMVNRAADCGVKYILPAFGLTIRDGQREYLYQQFDKHFPSLREKYISEFGNNYNCPTPKANELYGVFYNLCKEKGISTQMNFYRPTQPIQQKLNFE